MDWVYKQIIGFLANFFAEMGNMGAEMFEMSWVQSIVLFFSYLAWILYAVGFVVACAECGLEYSSGRADIKGTAMNLIKGFMAVSLFTVVRSGFMSFACPCRRTLAMPSAARARASARSPEISLTS